MTSTNSRTSLVDRRTAARHFARPGRASRLSTLVAVKNGGTTIASYVYDADGNRIQQTESSTTTDFYFSSAGQDLEDRQGSTVVDQYVWGIGYVNDLVLRDDNSSSGSYGKSSSGLGRRLFVQQDADWNVTALVNTSGTVVERFIQTPYGVFTVLTAAWASTTDSYSWVYGFQGGRYDTVTGMFQFDARDYKPSSETWMQSDPLGYVNGMNTYAPDGRNPSTNLDPSGTRWIPTPANPRYHGTPGIPVQDLVNGLRELLGAPVSVLDGDAFDPDYTRTNFGSGCDMLMFIPGILSDRGWANNAKNYLANQYGIDPLDSVIGNNNTHGLGDFVQIAGAELGAITVAGRRVANQLQIMAKHLNTLNGCKCKTIHVFAHSQGSQVFSEANALLDPQTRSMIDYNGYGGETWIAPGGLGSTRNTVNSPDPVPILGNILNPLKGFGIPFFLQGGQLSTFDNGNVLLDAHSWDKSYQGSESAGYGPAVTTDLKKCCDKN